MRSHSSISAAALAVALIATVPASQAQLLGVDLNLGGESGIDAGVSVGGDSLLDVDVDAGSGSSDDLLDVEVGGSGADDSLVDVTVGGGPATGPNGGTLIDLGVGTDEAVLDADVTLGGATGGAWTSVVIAGPPSCRAPSGAGSPTCRAGAGPSAPS